MPSFISNSNMGPSSIIPSAVPEVPKGPGPEVPFTMNEVRLTGRQWLLAVFLIALIAKLLPSVWSTFERFETGPDYRLPYSLSKDYWLHERRLKQVPLARSVLVLGDSVVWGEYVLPDGTLSHFLNQEVGDPDRFINAGINGMFPLALEGLYSCYGGPVRGRKVILHANLLWMSAVSVNTRTSWGTGMMVSMFLANVKDEPRPQPARLVRDSDFWSGVSFGNGLGRTRRDGCGRWLWRLVGRVLL